MLIIVSKNIELEALSKLEKIGEVFLFSTTGFVYPAISNHPDIFLAQFLKKIVAAPIISKSLFLKFEQHKIVFQMGKSMLGMHYPLTTPYNSCATANYFFHHLKYTDEAVMLAAEGLQHIHVEQGYTRCNLIALGEKGFITSDLGIAKVLQKLNQKFFYVNPKNIILHGFPEGFIGGACGYFDNTLYVHGSLSHLPESVALIKFLNELEIHYVELCKKPIMDIGSIFFLKSN